MVNYLTEGLAGVDHLQYRGPSSFRTAIDKQISGFQLGQAAQYVVFSPVTQEDFGEINNIRDAHYKGLRFMYLDGQRTLIAKFGVGFVHELAHRMFVRCFEKKLFQMGVDGELNPLGATGFSGPGGEKESDSAFRPSSRPPGADWPTLVLECGLSESLARLKVDAQWWLENSAGAVQAVIVVSVSRPERSLHLEKWELADAPNPGVTSQGPNSSTPEPIITQEVNIAGEKVNIIGEDVAGAGFAIDFTKIMLRRPLVQRGEGKFTFSTEELANFARRVWRASQ